MVVSDYRKGKGYTIVLCARESMLGLVQGDLLGASIDQRKTQMWALMYSVLLDLWRRDEMRVVLKSRTSGM